MGSAAGSGLARGAGGAIRGGMIRGVIFDLDGTLVDSTEAHVLSWVEALGEFGWTVAPELVRPLIGMGGDKLLPALIGVPEDGPEGRPIRKRRQRLMERLLPELRPFPGAQALLREVKGRGLRRALASSGDRKDVEQLLAVGGLGECFDHVVTADDAGRSKPDPDVIAAALARLGLAAGEVIMVGDTRYDVLAARKLGISTIGLRCGGASDEALVGTVAIYDDPMALLEQIEASVLAGPAR